MFKNFWTNIVEKSKGKEIERKTAAISNLSVIAGIIIIIVFIIMYTFFI